MWPPDARPPSQGLSDLINWGAGDLNISEQIADDDYSGMAVAIGYWLVGELDNIIAKKRDQNIKELADFIKNDLAGRPVFLRFGYEFDGNYHSGKYKQAYIRIHKIFAKKKVDNVVFVWQAGSSGTKVDDLRRWYPGSEYVDWMGYSHFGQPMPGNGIIKLAREEGKPVMIAEACLNNRDTTKPEDEKILDAWHRALFKHIRNNPEIQALAYINVDWKNQPMWMNNSFWGRTDSRVQLNETIKSLWISELGSGNWQLHDANLYDNLQ